MSLEAAEALRARGELSLIVLPRTATRDNPLARFARRHGIDATDTSKPLALERLIRERGLSLLCCASFPEKIASSVLKACTHGGINLHPSLLPKHRGVDPIFWTYVADDRETGVTIHEMSDRIDEGEILDQAAIPLDRGRSCMDLYRELSRLGASHMVRVVSRMADHGVDGGPQQGPSGGAEPSPAAADFSIPIAAWPAERVWHVLSGLGERYHELLRMPDGRVVRHDRATGYDQTVVTPGMIEERGGQLSLHCLDGRVFVKTWRRAGLLRRVARRVAGRLTSLRER